MQCPSVMPATIIVDGGSFVLPGERVTASRDTR